MTTFCQAFSTNLLFPARWPKEFVLFRYHVIQTISCYSKRNLILKQISQSKQSVKENNAPVMIGSDQECSFSCSPRAICAQKICLTKTLSEVFFCVGWMPFFRMCVLTVSGRSFTLYYECVTFNDCRFTLLLKSQLIQLAFEIRYFRGSGPGYHLKRIFRLMPFVHVKLDWSVSFRKQETINKALCFQLRNVRS